MKPSLSKKDLNRQRWRERINAWKNSSQSQKAFCEDQYLGLASFQRWCRILKAEDSEGLGTALPETVRFLAVKVQQEKPTYLTILIHDDLCIEVPAGLKSYEIDWEPEVGLENPTSTITSDAIKVSKTTDQ